MSRTAFFDRLYWLLLARAVTCNPPIDDSRLRTSSVIPSAKYSSSALPAFSNGSTAMRRTPADAVRWLGAVQAQDYAGALWAVGMRTRGAVEADVEGAVAERTIVRSWPLRGTLHFVAPDDLRWMLTHFAPRTIARAAPRFRQLELDERTFARSSALFVKALQGQRQLSRPRLYALLERAGISAAGSRGLHILWRSAHDGLICFGARQGNQHTFALLDEWVPPAKTLTPPQPRSPAMRPLIWRRSVDLPEPEAPISATISP